MKILKNVFTIAALIGLLAFSGTVFAAKPPGAGSGGGGSAGGGGKILPDYGDLFILYRDGNGVPYVTEYVDGKGMCQQPLPSNDCPLGCIEDGQTLINEIPEEVVDVEKVVKVDPATCSVLPECAICTQEVEFERDNVIRAKESVLDQQLQDATIKLATAGCVTLDPAGRPVASNVMESTVVSSAIDSPLQNLGFYKKLMRDGYVGSADSPIDLLAENFLISAARALGASAPKEGKIGIDTVVYMNEILGLTEPGASILSPLFQNVREEVKGVMTVVKKTFLNYGYYTYGDCISDDCYNRNENFSLLPSPAYIPSNNPTDGVFEYTVDNGSGSFSYTTGSILDAVFGDEAYSAGKLEGFTQAADDTRAVINFMHTWPVLGDSATPIKCGIITPEFYDISISERSGLQVPLRMAAAGDGREASVTVDNGGPATAYNVRVMVTGKYNDEEDVVLLDKMDGSPIFGEAVEEISEIMPGYSATITFFFVMDEAAEINWTATVFADDDANPDNNTVKETTIVNKPKGGGGGH